MPMERKLAIPREHHNTALLVRSSSPRSQSCMRSLRLIRWLVSLFDHKASHNHHLIMEAEFLLKTTSGEGA